MESLERTQSALHHLRLLGKLDTDHWDIAAETGVSSTGFLSSASF